MLQITPCERAALQMLADGIATHAIADRLGTSAGECEARLSTLFARMGVASQSDAVAVAFRRGLLVRATGSAGGDHGGHSRPAPIPTIAV